MDWKSSSKIYNQHDKGSFNCKRIEELVVNCTGFFRSRSFNQYYFNSNTSEHCDLLISMNEKCLKLKGPSCNHDVLEDLKKEAEKFSQLNAKSDRDNKLVNDVWELRSTPIKTWKTS